MDKEQEKIMSAIIDMAGVYAGFMICCIAGVWAFAGILYCIGWLCGL
jgi:hypothetical protein